jgi:hypothetical protein
VEGFGEAPGTLWVWAPGLLKNLHFSGVFASFAGKYTRKEGDSWRACSPPNLPIDQLFFANPFRTYKSVERA